MVARDGARTRYTSRVSVKPSLDSGCPEGGRLPPRRADPLAADSASRVTAAPGGLPRQRPGRESRQAGSGSLRPAIGAQVCDFAKVFDPKRRRSRGSLSKTGSCPLGRLRSNPG